MGPSATMSPPRATLALLTDCDNRCVFCAPDGLPAVAPRDFGELDRALASLAAGHDAVTLTGGEPALHPALPAVVAAARRRGFARVGLQTNGRRLREPGYAAALRDAGLTDIHLSLHGLGPAIHDHHAGVGGSFAEAAEGLAAARAAGLTAVVTTVLTRSNARSLPPLAAWLAARSVAAWAVAIPRTAGRLSAAFDQVFPRLAMALPPALHALATARQREVTVFLRGAPLCLVGPFAARSLPDAPRAYEPRHCDPCPARPWCPGVDARYLRRFGGDELSPTRAPTAAAPPALSAREQALADMFVGEGPGGPGPAAVESAPPGAARVSLPVVREGA
jgi:pyruvate-formate lyase-activating enzyme